MINYYDCQGAVPVTVIPKLLAEPATIFIPDSMVKQLRSGILTSAIALT